MTSKITVSSEIYQEILAAIQKNTPSQEQGDYIVASPDGGQQYLVQQPLLPNLQAEMAVAPVQIQGQQYEVQQPGILTPHAEMTTSSVKIKTCAQGNEQDENKEPTHIGPLFSMRVLTRKELEELHTTSANTAIDSQTITRKQICILNTMYTIPPGDVGDEEARIMLSAFDTQALRMPLEMLCKLWGLTDVFQSMQQHQIQDVHMLLKIDVEDINQLTPVVGYRIILRDLIYFMSHKFGLNILKSQGHQPAEPDTPADWTACHKFPDLRRFLCHTPTGKSIVTYYESQNCLDNGKRNELVKVIIFEALQRSIKLCTSFFEVMATKINALFPNESKELYYTPTTKIGGKTVRASGKFLMRKHKILNSLRVPEQPSQEPQAVEQTNVEEQEDAKSWLMQGREPEIMVRENWTKCRAMRRKLLAGSRPLDEIVMNYPILRTYLGGILLADDFQHSYEGKLNNFYSRFPKLHDKLPTLFHTLRDDESKQGVERYSKAESEDLKNLQLVRLLAPLVPTNYRVTSSWRPSTKEAIHGFIIIVKVADLPSLVNYVNTEQDIVLRYEYVKLGCVRIKPNTVLISEINDQFMFREILHIIDCDEKIQFICKHYLCVTYDDHLDAFILENDTHNVVIVTSAEINFYPNRFHTMPDGRKAVRVKS